MKKCEYCGREGQDDAAACYECGTPFPIPEVVALGAPALGSLPGANGQQLTAARATAVLMIFLGAQFLFAIGGGAVAGLAAGLGGADFRQADTLKDIVQRVTTPLTLVAAVAGGMAMLTASAMLFGGELEDSSPTGAAWRIGPAKDIVQGLLVGSAVGLGALVVASLAGPGWVHGQSTLMKMSHTPGFSRAVWVVLALMIAPPIEEMLFRGVLYGGYRLAMGPRRAALVTTLIFCGLHVGELIHFLPALVGIAGLAVTALWFRLRSSAIGPAVATHMGYNLVIALTVFASGP